MSTALYKSNAKVRKAQPEFIKLDPRKVCRMQIRDLFSGKVRPWVNAKTPFGSTMTRIGTKFIVGFRLSRWFIRLRVNGINGPVDNNACCDVFAWAPRPTMFMWKCLMLINWGKVGDFCRWRVLWSDLCLRLKNRCLVGYRNRTPNLAYDVWLTVNCIRKTKR